MWSWKGYLLTFVVIWLVLNFRRVRNKFDASPPHPDEEDDSETGGKNEKDIELSEL